MLFENGFIKLSEWRAKKGDLLFNKPKQWFKGEFCNLYPSEGRINAQDVMAGWAPDKKIIFEDTKALAFGSCFAEYFIKFLKINGYNKWLINQENYAICGENLLLSLGQTFENIFVIEQQFRWAFGDFSPTSHLWFTKDKKYFEATKERQANIKNNLSNADVAIITLGLSEIWYDKVENEPMWRSIPESIYDENRHAFKLASVEETKDALFKLHELCEKHLQKLKIVFTVSPIPLIATFRNQNAITANQISKSVIRVALDSFLTDPTIANCGRYYYFPSYELTFNLFDSPFEPDNRHVKPELATEILSIFGAAYTDIQTRDHD